MSKVDDALKQGTFDLLDFVQGQSRPKDTVTINVAEGLAYERGRLLSRLAESQGVKVLDEEGIETIYLNATEEERKVLREVDESLKAGEVVFHIEAIPQEVQETIRTTTIEEYGTEELPENDIRSTFGVEIPSPKAYEEYSFRLIVAAIRKVEVPHKDVEPFLPEPASLIQSLKRMPLSQIAKLSKAVSDLQVDGEFFESKVTPDF